MAKRKLNLTVDETLHRAIKHIAINQDTTVSHLVEEFIMVIKDNPDIIRVIKDINSKPKKVKSKV